MGKINIPDTTAKEGNFLPDKKDDEIADTLPKIDDEVKDKIKEEAGIREDNLTDEAIRLISYKRYLGIKTDDKDELSYLGKIDNLLSEEGLKRQKEKAEIIKEVQYKIGGKPDLRRVYIYLKIEGQIKNLVKKLKNI